MKKLAILISFLIMLGSVSAIAQEKRVVSKSKTTEQTTKVSGNKGKHGKKLHHRRNQTSPAKNGSAVKK